MVSKIGPTDGQISIRFGGGLHTRASEDQVDPVEATAGQNFSIDPGNRILQNRKPFDRVLTLPNGGAIRGGGTLLKSDGSISFLIQGGNTVYEWDGLASIVAKGTVNANAKLRGHWSTHNWTLGDKLILTDLALLETVKQWDGTTFSDVIFTDENSAPFGAFSAKYLVISNERAIFGYVKDSGATTPHMMVGAKAGDFTQITVSNRPASALNELDPFFLLTPDLKPINGLADAFGSLIVSSERGRLFNLAGSSAKDFSFNSFFPGSAASGSESITFIGKDVVYGRPGRIESVTDTDRFGDAENNDLTFKIAPSIETHAAWTIVYNSRTNTFYAFPQNKSEVWVAKTAMLGGTVSPWMKWTTTHALAYQPTFVMPMLDPQDGLEYIFMGDVFGNLYRLEGTGTGGDGGTDDIVMEWTTALFTPTVDANVYDIEGIIKYRKNEAATVTLTFLYSGSTAYDNAIIINVPAISGAPSYGGNFYYGGTFYGAPFAGRFIRQQFAMPGQSNEFRVKVSVAGKTDIQISGIDLKFTASS